MFASPIEPDTSQIAFGSVIEGAIAVPTEHDFFSFYGDAGDKVTVRLKPSGGFDSRLRVVSPSDSVLASQYGDHGALNGCPDKGIAYRGEQYGFQV